MAACISSAITSAQAVAVASTSASSSASSTSNGDGSLRVSSAVSSFNCAMPIARRTNRYRQQVLCMATPQGEEPIKTSTTDGVSSTTPPTPSVASSPSPISTPKPKQRPEGFGDLMAFSGPAPELINGRLAMLGFVAGVVAERISGLTFLEQFQSAQGPIIGAAVVFALASVIPKFVSGTSLTDLVKDANKKNGGILTPFNADVERLHGRLAMLGFAATLIIEASNGSGIFNA